MASFLFNAYGNEKWDGDVFISITTFDNDRDTRIVGSVDYRFSLSEARKLLRKLSDAVDEVDVRNMIDPVMTEVQ